MDRAFILAHLDHTLDDGGIAELPGHYRGKVRDTYLLDGDRRLLVASDRLSAFDRNLCSVPFKGQVLTTVARHAFDATADICTNHVIAYPDPNAVLCRNLAMLPIEIVVRGYLAGTTSTSILTMYRAGAREMYGLRFPDGLRDNDALPRPIVTPTTKGAVGDHDAPLSGGDVVDRGLLSAARWDEVHDVALALFARGHTRAAACGLILADTKYEFGLDGDGRLVLADEVHTPDSSRFWAADSWAKRVAAGRPPESFDKDVVRRWVSTRCDPYAEPVPAIPRELIADTALTYVAACERLTGQVFTPDLSGDAIIDRVRANLLPLIAA